MAATKGGSLADLRILNAGTVFELIQHAAPISRAQISRLVGLTRPTVSSALETLLEANLVRETSKLAGQRHYGATFFQTAPDAAYFVALDVDRRQFRAILADAVGDPVASIDTNWAVRQPVELVAQVAEAIDELCASAGVSRQLVVLAVLGVPAAVNPVDGELRLSAYELLEGYPLGPAVTAAIGLPSLVENDVNLAAIGEQSAGAAIGVPDFVYLTIGRNVGSGIVLGNEIRRGAHGAAGEVDAPVVDAEPVPTGPAADAFEALASQILGPDFTGFPPNPAAVFAAAADQHPLAEQIVAEQARRIAELVAMLGRVLDLGLVVLGGGIGRRCGPILEQIEHEVAARLPLPPSVVISQVSERPVLVGARTVGRAEALRLVTTERLTRIVRRTG